METKIKTYITEDYDKFKTILGNRLVNEVNVQAIIKNIKENGYVHTVVICNENMEIIDGQHRVEALKRLGMPVYYQVIEGLTAGDCITLNTASKNWKITDFILSYAERGNEDFKLLSHLIETHPTLTPTTVISVAWNSKCNAVATVKSGKFRFRTPIEKVKESLDELTEIMPVFASEAGEKSVLAVAIAYCINNGYVDRKKMKRQLKNYGLQLMDSIPRSRNVFDKLEEIYNYHSPKKEYFAREIKLAEEAR